MEARIIDSQDLIKIAIEQTLEGIQVIGRDWKYLYVNHAAARQGRSLPKELLGRTMMQCYPGIENTETAHVIESVLSGGPARQFENLFEFPDGQRCWFMLSIEPHPEGALIRSLDITERKVIEEQYRHSQKMESIGLLAGGIAHDFNNKLGIMMIYCDLIEASLQGRDETVRRYLYNVVTALKDANALTKQLLAFSRKQVLDPRVVSLNDLVEGVADSLRKLIGEDIELKLHCDRELSNVRVDPSQIDQVLLNLSINARDAMPGGGTLTIETANVVLDRDYAAAHVGVTPGPYVMLSISDTGTGMPPDVKARVFEPFFTTKGKGKGTGLGLASVHGIVAQSRGHVWVYSEPGHGTSFKIYFPQIKESSQLLTLPLDEEAVALSGTETILLVEDDQLLRKAFGSALENAGYKVFLARDPAEAKKIFTEHNGQFDLLVTDVIMPGSTGHNLATDLATLKKDLKVIYVSGYTENTILHHGVLNSAAVLLQKPVATKNLLSTVRQVIDGKVTQGVF